MQRGRHKDTGKDIETQRHTDIDTRAKIETQRELTYTKTEREGITCFYTGVKLLSI